MADERSPDDPKIEEILNDLDTILSDLNDVDAATAQMVQLPPPAAATPPPAPIAQPPKISAPVVQPPKPAPASAPKASQSAALPAAPLPKPVAAPPAAPPPKPVAAPPASVVQPPKPSAVPPPAPVAKPAMTPPPPVAVPKPAAAPSAPPQPAPANAELKIELAPREGTIPPLKKPESPPAPKKPAAGLPPTRPPVELPLAEPPAPVAAPKPAAAPSVPPRPAPVSEKKAEAAPADDVPEGTPHEYVRRVAALFLPAYAESIPQFFAFLGQSAQTVSKKPLFLRRVLVAQIDPACDAAALVARAQAANAVAAIAIIEGLAEGKAKELAAAFAQAKIDYREVSPGDLLKRSAAVDILVEIMLLPSEL